MVPTPGTGADEEASRLGLQHHVEAGTHTLAATGELDLVEAPRLEQLVEELTRDQIDLVLDLDELGFLDSTGVRAILVANEMVERSGGTMTVTLGNPKVNASSRCRGSSEPRRSCPRASAWQASGVPPPDASALPLPPEIHETGSEALFGVERGNFAERRSS